MPHSVCKVIITSKVKIRSLDMLRNKFNAHNSCAEVYIYSQEDKIAIIIVIRRIILRRIFSKGDTGHGLDRAGSG